MKQIQEPIEITAQDPLEFLWRGRRYRVTRSLERWYYRGKWWLTPDLKGESRHYYRVCCELLEVRARGKEPVGPYSMAYRTRSAQPELGGGGRPQAPTRTQQERVFEIFQILRDQRWVLSRVVD